MAQARPQAQKFDGPVDNLRIGIVAARFNPPISEALLDGARRGLAGYKIKASQWFVVRVPGAFEIPLAALKLADGGKCDAVICLGAVIRGQTPHFETVCRAVTDGVLAVNLETQVPTIFGVLTCDDQAQARQRAGDGEDNKGTQAAHAAMEMIAALRRIEQQQ